MRGKAAIAGSAKGVSSSWPVIGGRRAGSRWVAGRRERPGAERERRVDQQQRGCDSTYHRLDAIRVEVAFDQSVDVTGTPQLALTIGTVTRQANYASGTGTDTLTFRYTVAVTDVDADGISIGASALALNSGTIQLAGGATAANLGLGAHAISNAAAHKVDGSRVRTPAVLSVALNRPPLDQWQTAFAAGHWIEVTVGFSVAVDVTGVPQVAIGIGTETRQARYASGNGDEDAGVPLSGARLRSEGRRRDQRGAQCAGFERGDDQPGGEQPGGVAGLGEYGHGHAGEPRGEVERVGIDAEQSEFGGHVRGGRDDRGDGVVELCARRGWWKRAAVGACDWCADASGVDGSRRQQRVHVADVSVRGSGVGRGRGRAEHRGERDHGRQRAVAMDGGAAVFRVGSSGGRERLDAQGGRGVGGRW